MYKYLFRRCQHLNNEQLCKQIVFQAGGKKTKNRSQSSVFQLVFSGVPYSESSRNWWLKAFWCLKEGKWVPASLIHPGLTVIWAPTLLSPLPESPNTIMCLSDTIKVLPSTTLCTQGEHRVMHLYNTQHISLVMELSLEGDIILAPHPLAPPPLVLTPPSRNGAGLADVTSKPDLLTLW